MQGYVLTTKTGRVVTDKNRVTVFLNYADARTERDKHPQRAIMGVAFVVPQPVQD